jgi:transcriptional regulator with XRE-family HTH domain
MLVKARAEAGLTQGELARKVGIAQPSISDIEAGKRRLDLVELTDILRALDVPPLQFLREFLSQSN